MFFPAHARTHRNKDLRLEDNTALSYASAVAQEHSLPLIALHIFSLGDYKAHDRSPRRIDFQLRQLAYLRAELDKLDIPLFTFTQSSERKAIPRSLCEKLAEWKAFGVYANIEYEVDELRRDIEVLERTRDAREKKGVGWKGQVEFFKDFCIVAPGELLTKVRSTCASCDAVERSIADLRVRLRVDSKASLTASTRPGNAPGQRTSTRTFPPSSRLKTVPSSPTPPPRALTLSSNRCSHTRSPRPFRASSSPSRRRRIWSDCGLLEKA